MTSENRLFVPLSAEPYEWFKTGQKKWELRKYGRQYTEKNVRPGRRVELRRGYSDSGRALWGTILAVKHEQDIAEFFKWVPFEDVIPTANSLTEAIAVVEKILNLDSSYPEPVLGFQVALER